MVRGRWWWYGWSWVVEGGTIRCVCGKVWCYVGRVYLQVVLTTVPLR
jgi:hypothetical protein